MEIPDSKHNFGDCVQKLGTISHIGVIIYKAYVITRTGSVWTYKVALPCSNGIGEWTENDIEKVVPK